MVFNCQVIIKITGVGMKFTEPISKAFESVVGVVTGSKRAYQDELNKLVDKTYSFSSSDSVAAAEELVKKYGGDKKAQEAILDYLQRGFEEWRGRTFSRKGEAFSRTFNTFYLGRLAGEAGHPDLAKDIGRHACRYVEESAYMGHRPISPKEFIRQELEYYAGYGEPIAEAVKESLSRYEVKDSGQTSPKIA
jgi:hypothetical protein